MDIQFAYNLERLLYFMCDENTSYVAEVMTEVENEFNKRPGAKGAQLNASTLSNIQATFSSISVSDADTLATIRRVQDDCGYALCPHSAIGVHGARNIARHPEGLWSSANPMVCVLTAHPSKFPETFMKATGKAPPVCSWSNVLELVEKEQRFELLQKDCEEQWEKDWVGVLKKSVSARSRMRK